MHESKAPLVCYQQIYLKTLKNPNNIICNVFYRIGLIVDLMVLLLGF